MGEPVGRRLSTPKGLGVAGRRVWKSIVSAYALRPDEQIVLESACRVADVIDQLGAAMAGEPMQVKGSMGQLREHPLLSEGRQQRALLARLLAQLKLPEDATAGASGQAEHPGGYDRSRQARRAAIARWHPGMPAG